MAGQDFNTNCRTKRRSCVPSLRAGLRRSAADVNLKLSSGASPDCAQSAFAARSLAVCADMQVMFDNVEQYMDGWMD